MKEKAERSLTKRKITTLIVTILSVLIFSAATVFTVWFAVNEWSVAELPEPVDPNPPSDPVTPDPDPSQPSSGEEAVKFTNPLKSVVVLCAYGFSHNETLGWFYEHDGVDLTADEGAEVYAMADGVVLSLSSDEVSGTQIAIDHGDGLVTTYSFVDPLSSLKQGDSVKKGDKIATVSKPSGNEYKSGSHLHLSVSLSGECVDPTEYLVLDEK